MLKKLSRRFTLTESLLRSIKKGKASEQLLATEVLMLSFLQFGIVNSDVIAILGDSRKLLLDTLDDEKVEPDVRAACIKALGLGIFCANETTTDSITVLEKLELIFANSYAKGDGSLRVYSPKVYELHAAALATWGLLLCSMPLHFVNKLSQK
jgi:hypothetical protein